MRQQMASAITIVVQATRMSDGTRKITSISEITGMEENVISMQEIFTFQKKGIGPDGRVIGAFVPTRIRPRVPGAAARVGHDSAAQPVREGNAGQLRRKEGAEMGLIIGLVFVGVFAIVALPLIASALSPSRKLAAGAGHAGLGAQAGDAGRRKPLRT